jgi:diguanylate cyclase (GGDEF)-like protein
VALLQGSGGTTGKRARMNRRRAAEPAPDPGPPLRSLLPTSEPTDVREPVDHSGPAQLEADVELRVDSDQLRVEHAPIRRGGTEGGEQRSAAHARRPGAEGQASDADGRAGLPSSGGPSAGVSSAVPHSTGSHSAGPASERPVGVRGNRPGRRRGVSVTALEASLLRLAASGPTPADVLDQLVQDAAVLFDAPTRIALAIEDHLIWAAASDGAGAVIGAEVDVERTACGAAWRTGLIQNVSAPPASAISRQSASSPVDDGEGPLTTDCCGSVPALLVIPLLREGPAVEGRHAGFFREVFGVLALSGERADSFDDDGIEAGADLAEVAGERIAALTQADAAPADDLDPGTVGSARRSERGSMIQRVPMTERGSAAGQPAGGQTPLSGESPVTARNPIALRSSGESRSSGETRNSGEPRSSGKVQRTEKDLGAGKARGDRHNSIAGRRPSARQDPSAGQSARPEQRAVPVRGPRPEQPAEIETPFPADRSVAAGPSVKGNDGWPGPDQKRHARKRPMSVRRPSARNAPMQSGAEQPAPKPARQTNPGPDINWPPFLTPPTDPDPSAPSATVPEPISPADVVPPTTTSITVVPASRPGRSGFGGWFARASKMPSAKAIPNPRVGPGGWPRSMSARRVAIRTSLELSASPEIPARRLSLAADGVDADPNGSQSPDLAADGRERTAPEPRPVKPNRSEPRGSVLSLFQPSKPVPPPALGSAGPVPGRPAPGKHGAADPATVDRMSSPRETADSQPDEPGVARLRPEIRGTAPGVPEVRGPRPGGHGTERGGPGTVIPQTENRETGKLRAGNLGTVTHDERTNGEHTRDMFSRNVSSHLLPQQDLAEPEMTQHESVEPELAQHESAEHESVEHESAQHESAQHESAQHESVEPELAQHESAQHESAQHESAQHESVEPESVEPESAQHESAQHESAEHESADDSLAENSLAENGLAENNVPEQDSPGHEPAVPGPVGRLSTMPVSADTELARPRPSSHHGADQWTPPTRHGSLFRRDLLRAEPERHQGSPERQAPERHRPVPERSVRIEPIPKRLARSDATAGFGPASRLVQVRPRAAVGSPLAPAIPAPDSLGLWQWDALSGGCTWSSPVARLLGMPADAELTLEAVREAVVPADRGRFDVAVQAIASGRGVAGALRFKTLDGRTKQAYAWSEVRRDDAGRFVGAWGGVVDVTAFEHDAAALRSGLAGLRAAQELTGLATWEWRADAEQLIWSEEMYRLAGVSTDTFQPTPAGWHAFVHPDDLDRAYRLDLGAALEAEPGQDGHRVETFRLIARGGEIRHVQSWSSMSADRVVYGATMDVTRQVHDRMTLERLSATDPVTGLGNRLAFDRRMQQLLSNPGSQRSGSIGPVEAAGSVTLILLDLDRFKVVNDSLGHQLGDRLLIEVARRLVAVVPEGSVTARMGGDEFVVVPPAGVVAEDVHRLAASVVEALRAPYVLPETGELLICPASLGVAMSQGRRVSGHDLLREADIALYRAKDSGRDQFVVFDEALKARTKARQRAERRLRTALEEDRLEMQFQPVIDFTSGSVVGAEGLVRLYDGDGGSDSTGQVIDPDLFLDIAEQTGLVVELDCWAIETAIRQLRNWTRRGDETGPWLAINLSARSLEHPRVVRRLVEAVRTGEVDPDRIKIQLTEQSFIGALAGVDAGLYQLLTNNIGVGIDDFGTGYSALAYLQHFDLDFMKIDPSFITSVGEGPRGDAVVTAIVDLAHAHGMRVIAEGVESGRQARRLREIGCDFAQGFHFGRPGEADRIVRG